MNRALARLDALAVAWSRLPGSRALLGCGSMAETERADRWSDVDFFAVTTPEWHTRRADDLGWLEGVKPLVYRFRNESDAWQVLFEDGVYAEFGVVTEESLATIPHTTARIVWAAGDFDTALAASTAHPPVVDPRRAVGLALSFLYVGMCRYRRGERLSAWKFVQGQAFEHVLALWDPETRRSDPFSRERRFEARVGPEPAALASMLGGYDRTPESALAQLAFLEARGADPVMAGAIRRLAST